MILTDSFVQCLSLCAFTAILGKKGFVAPMSFSPSWIGCTQISARATCLYDFTWHRISLYNFRMSIDRMLLPAFFGTPIFRCVRCLQERCRSPLSEANTCLESYTYYACSTPFLQQQCNTNKQFESRFSDFYISALI